MKMNIGLQIYTVRDEMSAGIEEVMKKIAEAGYDGVELTYNPDKADEIAEMSAKYGLKITGAHISFNEIENKFDTVKAFADKTGFKKIIIPWIGNDHIDTAEKTRETAKKFEAAAQKLKAEGYELLFHNHVIEYEDRFDGKNVIDIFLEEAPTLKHEIDIGWAFAAGADVPAYIKKMGDRLSVVHIKDIDDNKTPTEIGSGKVDMKAALEAAWNIGVTWGVVEQDNCINYKPFESIKVSYDYIKTINK